MNIEFVNIILYCKKWNETVAFYKTKLKLPVTVSFEWFVEFRLNEFSRLSIANEERSSIKSSRGKGHTITMKVSDIKNVYSELKNSGLDPTDIKKHKWGAEVIYIYDPEGNRLEFWSDNIE